ncbi:MAG: cation:proton antiporter [Flavobacterium sp.]|uniref:Cation:proton antiporter n=1 Tax=Flavobacterium celericrescens TaxID=2709780 RepID=A0ABX0IE46_9FLAO|nr:cation:proton antiporter [Flavobacterium celericrescens]NHM04460.1 cation:proton antiporter [Flavobacterium celericrescens]
MPFNVQSLELPFFANLLILLVLARLFGEIMERFKQPAMIGEILAGVLLGPTILNFIHRTEELKVISELGIFLLVIIAGLEIHLDEIVKSMKGRNIFISIAAFFIPLFSGYLVGICFDLDVMSTVFIGLCVAITALPVSIRILMDLGKLNSHVGQKIISVAIFDDVIALTILGILLDIKDVEPTFANITQATIFTVLKLTFFLLIIILTYKMIQKLAQKENFIENQLNNILSFLKGKESLFAVFFVFILIFATITESIGLHFIIGAFFASMLISKELVGEKHLETFHNTTNSMAMGFLAPIFFAGIGLEFQFSSIQNYPLLLAIIAVSFLSKIIGGYIGGRFARLNHKVSLALGIGLNARGIMELVIANIAYKAGIINTEIFSMLVIMGLITTLSTPFLLKRAFKSIDKVA